MAIWSVVKYRCSNNKCKAEDHDKVADGGSPIPCFNCWRCGNGRGLEPHQMMAQQRGMFPVASEAPVPVN